MSLVNYDSSSDSESSDAESTSQTTTISTTISSSSTATKRSLSSLLPPPTKKKTVYVDLPKLTNDHADEDEPKVKRTKITTGLSLADLLPKPKNTPLTKNSTHIVPVTKTTTDEAFVPYALAKKMREKGKAIAKDNENDNLATKHNYSEATVEPVERTAVEEEKQNDAETEDTTAVTGFTGSFFKVGKELKEKEPLMVKSTKPKMPTLEPTITVQKPSEDQIEQYNEPVITAADAYAYDPNAMYSADPNVYYQYQQQEGYEGDPNNGNDIDLERLLGRKAKGESNIQFKTINQQDILPSEEWRAAQTLTQAPKFHTGPAMSVSKLQSKKNNIMALAAHAVNNQERLDEMFAANKRTKRDASKKYGKSRSV
ncbi:mitotic checkpoint regulator, MAD2B-interacting-domain-containing protein [Mycotypha africana]|uniref:mitotic checkpoint regulator, MAD2B-interacting-domain-containing protein n=1 Tax=Mycotypha africana TaxID=64632 RepID=UPI0023017E54|nr:mitotic checkpoint regulator, MAD2B-interacting-domain-containing protein [Mycotypha africana]KAI8982275.1 mitotic checkpoint regulator, MAD2B-interacting-domain-containing protein [Mycotypha africana]